MALQLRPKLIILRNQALIHRFSSSSSSSDNHEEQKNDPQPQPPPPPPQSSQTKSSMSSYFSDVKASLNQTSTSPFRRLSQQSQDSPSSASPASQPPKVASLSEIRKNLSDFRATPLSSDKTRQSSKPVSFQDLYKRNTVNVETDRTDRTDRTSGNDAFRRIRESLQQIRSNTANRLGGGHDVRNNTGVLDLKEFKGSLNVKTSPVVMGGSDSVPSPFKMGRKDAGSGGGGGDAKDELRNDLARTYTYDDLGEQLYKLRSVDTPTGKVGLSLTELNERLIKLRQIENKKLDEHIAGVTFGDLKISLLHLQNEEGKTKKTSLQGVDILGNIGGTSTYMLDPPKEELVEKYFHPDNMSSAEKLKLELKKVRDEFKMSESDCGSSRVQVAQLTTKIKHLSSVLHKKDKHSRKGLQEMVQRRKKLLKYLRRTDWDSYCFCLSKLGLRDNPDYKS